VDAPYRAIDTIFQTIVMAKANVGSLAALPNFKKGVN